MSVAAGAARAARRARLGLAALVTVAVVVAACDGGAERAEQVTVPAPPETEPAPAAPVPNPPPPPAPTPPAPAAPPPLAPSPSPPVPPRGGTVRIGWERGFGFSAGLDPTSEYLGEAMGILSNLLVRTLVGHRHVAGPEGDELVPDLATDLGTTSDDGRSVTFTLKDGVAFGPPLSRPITSDDVRFAFERIGTPPVGAQYGFYYDVIEGMEAFRAGESDTITGIETPDERTVVFHLSEPAGDFVHRLSLPAAAPQPPEVSGCFHDPAVYGRYLVASGPYTIAGYEDQDASACETLTPLSGFDPAARLTLVRNPDYDGSTDTAGARTSLPDRFVYAVYPGADEIAAAIESGELDGEVAGPTPDILERYTSDPALASRLHVNANDDLRYLAFNVTRPPFDDLHVRRAVSLLVDKEAIRDALGGPVVAEIATHAFPDSLLGGLLSGYDPYPSAGEGNLARARAELSLSRFDPDGDGLCDGPACTAVPFLVGDSEVDAAIASIVERSLAPIGIDLAVEALPDLADVLATSPGAAALSLPPGWAKDYADPSTFAVLVAGESIGPPAGLNASLVGLTADSAARVGLQAPASPVPSLDDAIGSCRATPIGAERLRCWADLDRTLMEDVVPWVPLLATAAIDIVGPAVARYGFDQFSGGPAWAHWSVDPVLQPSS